MAQLYIAAAHKSSGKTTITLGLCAALMSAGRQVQPFKKGPDYIDPIWLSLAAGRTCYNLDFHTMSNGQISALVNARTAGAQLAVIEGNKGLFDGTDLHGRDSNAALAGLLQAPVLLTLDTRGMTRGIAPLVLGYQAFGPKVNLAGVILNRVGGSRHEAKLRAALSEYTDVPVVGAIPNDGRLTIEERHLGLVPGNESRHAADKLVRIRRAVAAGVDLDHVTRIADGAVLPRAAAPSTAAPKTCTVRIGIPRDAAFGFYYPDDLEALENAGAALVFFDSLNDERLPDVDGLFLGGGFPETQMERLQSNRSLRRDVLRFVKDGGPVYAECGGLMYLGRRLRWRQRECEMVGALPLDVTMHEQPVGRGYVRLAETGDSPWGSIIAGGHETIRAHEFHYSRVENLDAPRRYAYRVRRGSGIDGEYDGLIYRNVIASYAHLRSIDPVLWTQRFVEFVAQCAH